MPHHLTKYNQVFPLRFSVTVESKIFPFCTDWSLTFEEKWTIYNMTMGEVFTNLLNSYKSAKFTNSAYSWNSIFHVLQYNILLLDMWRTFAIGYVEDLYLIKYAVEIYVIFDAFCYYIYASSHIQSSLSIYIFTCYSWCKFDYFLSYKTLHRLTGNLQVLGIIYSNSLLLIN